MKKEVVLELTAQEPSELRGLTAPEPMEQRHTSPNQCKKYRNFLILH